SSRPRLAPPPPPPKKPGLSPTPPEKPPREQTRISVEVPCSEIYQQLPSPKGDPTPQPPSTSCDDGPIPRVPTIPLPQSFQAQFTEERTWRICGYERIELPTMNLSRKIHALRKISIIRAANFI
ncbi:hypothetical protein OSTOST_16013, partial [Ostertagia ostertagi]